MTLDKVKVVYEDQKPTPKVGAGLLAGALTVVGIAIYEGVTGQTIEAAVAASVTVLVTFLVGYFVKEN